MGAHRGGSIVVQRDRLVIIREMAVPGTAAKEVLEAAAQEALRLPDRERSGKYHPYNKRQPRLPFFLSGDSVSRLVLRQPEAFSFAFLLYGGEEFFVFAAFTLTRTDDLK